MAQLRDHLEHAIRVLTTLKAEVELVPKGSLDRFVMKTKRVIDNRSKEKREKYDAASKVVSAKYFD